MELTLPVLHALAACAFLCKSLQADSIAPPAPCREEGCPNITVYLGPRWGSRVIYPDTVELAPSVTDGENVFRTENHKTTPPITHRSPPATDSTYRTPPTNTDSKSNILGAVARTATTRARKSQWLQFEPKVLTKPDAEEGVEALDGEEPKPTSVYDRDSESDESFAAYLDRIKEMRKPVPDDGSFFLDIKPEDVEVDKEEDEGYLRGKLPAQKAPEPFDEAKLAEQGAERILPIGEQASFFKHDVTSLPNTTDLGVLNWSHYQLTGQQLKKALYSLAPYVRERIRILDVSSNLIRDLEPLTFPPELERHLEQLRFDDNPLQYLSSSSRFELSRLPKLKVLTLGRTSLRSFPPLLLPSLESLDLQGNLLTEVPDTLLSIPTLEELDLSNNRIAGVSEPVSLARLRLLVLNHNSISTISANTFRDCYDLKQVYLRYNQLTSVPMELFDSPAIFYLDNNPLEDEIVEMLGHKGAVSRPFCPSCPGLPSWVYSFTLNSSLLLVALLALLLAVLAIRSKLTRLPPYRILDEKSPM